MMVAGMLFICLCNGIKTICFRCRINRLWTGGRPTKTWRGKTYRGREKWAYEGSIKGKLLVEIRKTNDTFFFITLNMKKSG